jgi:putative ABC transport system substrate-binding protein
VASIAQQNEPVRRMAMLLPFDEGDLEARRRLEAVQGGLRQLGWRDGRNLHVDILWLGKDDLSRGPAYATEVVELKPEVIFSASTPMIALLKQATSTIPIVFAAVADPVGSGFVTSLASPGGNITGFTSFEPSLAGKWIELIKELAPLTGRVSFLYGFQTGDDDAFLSFMESASTSLGIKLLRTPIHSATEIESAIAVASDAPGSGLVVRSDVFLLNHRDAILKSAARHQLPAIYSFRDWVVSGGLISYGPDLIDEYRRAPAYIDRILRGARPSELPVQQPTKFELVVNLKTAKALGITIPQPLVSQADEVIE